MKFTDRTMAVGVSFRFQPKQVGTEIDHAVEIAPKTLFTRLLSPVIRGATRSQVQIASRSETP